MRVLIIDPLADPRASSAASTLVHVSKLQQMLKAWRLDAKSDLAINMGDVDSYMRLYKYNVVLICDNDDTRRYINNARHCDPRVAIIVLSQVSDNLVACLGWGADDYRVTPVIAEELVARMKTIVLRHRGYDQHVVQCGPIRLDFDTQRWLVPEWRGNLLEEYAPVHLMPALWKVLECLVLRAGEVCTRTDILEHLYGTGSGEHDIEAIDVFIYHLRKKFAVAGIPANTIESSWGRGYRINPLANGPAIPKARGGRPRKRKIEQMQAAE
ncbi:MAG TPA: response regulator transcription factor [Xanthobacteraceae bacterium]|nr:response regulator transcription factor [Xanthobacteraceae bacterium]